MSTSGVKSSSAVADLVVGVFPEAVSPMTSGVTAVGSSGVTELSMPPPALLKRPDRLVLGPAAGQGRPDRPQCQGLKAVNKISVSSEPGEHVSFVTVFTTYSSDPAGAGKRSSDVVTVGKYSYSKEERSMAILNTFVSFIQNSVGVNAKKRCDNID